MNAVGDVRRAKLVGSQDLIQNPNSNLMRSMVLAYGVLEVGVDYVKKTCDLEKN